jgi:hypothetical protein
MHNAYCNIAFIIYLDLNSSISRPAFGIPLRAQSSKLKERGQGMPLFMGYPGPAEPMRTARTGTQSD